MNIFQILNERARQQQIRNKNFQKNGGFKLRCWLGAVILILGIYMMASARIGQISDDPGNLLGAGITCLIGIFIIILGM